MPLTFAFPMKPLQSISVFGLGKLGSCIAATLAARGFDVLGVDVDPGKVARINAGQPPVEEPLLAETMTEGRGRLRATVHAREAVSTDASFFIPPSPSLPDGSFTTEYLLRAMQSAAAAVKAAGKSGHLFVVNSTTTPGAIREVLVPMLEKELGGVCGRDFGVCYNPEFIALGNVVRGLLEPDVVLIGESDAASGDRLADLYRRYNTNRPRISRMAITSAEIAKISLNSYITMKISFTNQLRLIAERFPEANIHDILASIGADSRVGSKYLRAGLSYGGPCFPRDNRLVSYTARRVGLTAPLAEASDAVNESAKQDLLEKILAETEQGDLIAVLGMAYKPDTYITEEAAGLYLAQKLKQAGRRVVVHDPVATSANSPSLFEFEQIPDAGKIGELPGLKLVAICCPCSDYASIPVPAGVALLDPWGVRPA